MNIGFVNFTPMIYDVDTPYKEPLGGSESAMCYLAVELSRLGHNVTLFGRLKESFNLKGVKHKPDRVLVTPENADLDLLIIQNTPFFGMQTRRFLGKKAKQIFWCQHNPDQSPVRLLHSPQLVNHYEKIVFVSDWQKDNFIKTFKLESTKCEVLGNAIAPSFENLFKDTSILKYKPAHPTLAYTTIPQRGLDILLDIFPQVRKLFPKVVLKIFSSMRVYQQENNEVDTNILNRARQMSGVEYIGSIGQSRLAKEQMKISILAYPNIVAETFCTGIIEALSAGETVVTSDLGAIPDTASGFAQLVPIGNDRDKYCRDYLEIVLSAIKEYYSEDKKKLNARLGKQVKFVNTNHTWKIRAKQWEKILSAV